MRSFGTRGPVNAQENYIVSRTEETADFSNRVKEGRYIVLFARASREKRPFFNAPWTHSQPLLKKPQSQPTSQSA